ncbi:hypothetical protein [Ammoniphilus sp. CFH 90114]|uniref:hypothetical protein n=1 Tax=Ammoniphilus sp. CFH 90114 TaxID=2493665 RepID=UPI00100FA7A7|nr:hypothetical protein [Ammoniphilus sp. CFH 90114]RXT07828.1 hypothetical protein EIZ39_10385 [Ammoniphilus sp. CFH 90114]
MNKSWLSFIITVLFLSSMSGGIVGAEDEDAIQVQYRSHTIGEKNSSPIEVIEAPIRHVDPSVNPPGITPGDVDGDPSIGDGDIDGERDTNVEKINPSDVDPPDIGRDGVNPPGVNPGDVSTGGVDPDSNNPGNINPDNHNPVNPLKVGNVTPGGVESGKVGSGEIGSKEVGDPSVGSGQVETGDGSEVPPLTWKEKLLNKVKETASKTWDKVKDAGKKLGRGLAAGAVGAGVVVAIVAGVAALVGVTLSAPVILIGLGVGVAAGVVYSFVSGDNFSFLKGAAISGLASIAAMGIAKMGAVAIARAAGGFLKRGAMSGLQAVKNGFQAIKQAPIAFLKGQVFNPGVYYSFGFSMVWNVLDFGMKNNWSRPPTAGEFGVMLGTSALSALVFGKVASAVASKRKNWFTKRLSESAVGVLESGVATTIKGGAHTVSGYLAGVAGSFLPKPVTHYFKKLREKRKIGTTITELNQHGIQPTLGQKTVTNKRLDQIGTTEGRQTEQAIDRLKHSQGQVTQRQMDQLLENTKAMNQLEMQKGIYGLGEKALKNEFNTHILKPGMESGVDLAEKAGEKATDIISETDAKMNQYLDQKFEDVDSKVSDLLDTSKEDSLKKTGTSGN